MLDFFLVAGSMYLMYRWGIRQMIRSRILKSWISDSAAKLMFIGAGCTLSLYLSFSFLFPLIPDWSIPAKSVIPTVIGIFLGEWFYKRNLAITMRMFTLPRSKEDQRDE
ncbi:hypothetical protein [Effusibacillus lacus]|uniref:hypothetical protein n=1 Tax=Effusibacillus lacus TaxID=1348429 RepID=UPI00105272E6|nr:hypothetical protein [Effusibacillus lacus]